MRNIIKWALLVLILCAIGWMANASFKKVQVARSAKEKLTTLPVFSLITLDSSAVESSSLTKGLLILIYFNSECDHCQYEVQDIKNNVTAFSKTTLVFMSSEPLAKIQAFTKASGLSDQTNISFTKITSNDAFTSFGALAVPHVFIYGPDKILRKEFKDETKAKAILKYLNLSREFKRPYQVVYFTTRPVRLRSGLVSLQL
jgi:peroxiredoxin